MIGVLTEAIIAVVGASMALSFYRLVRGPSIPDRVVGADAVVTNLMGLIVLFAIETSRPVFFVAVLVLAILGFVGTVAYAKFIERGSIIE